MKKVSKKTNKTTKTSKKATAKKKPVAKADTLQKKKNTKKAKNEDDLENLEEVIPLEDLKDLDIIEDVDELELKPKKKKKVITKYIKPEDLEDEVEIKKNTYTAKTLTEALVGPTSATKNEPVVKVKGKYLKFELEYFVHSSVRLLFEFISTPSGLSEWFADDVNFRNGIFYFTWDKVEQKAKLLKIKENKLVRFQWLEEENKDLYFEFRIEVDDLTGDVALVITDFAENDETRQAATLLWNSQVETLLSAIGSY
jgi:uncharacterized protein YndB with AHSA1/START domain